MLGLLDLGQTKAVVPTGRYHCGRGGRQVTRWRNCEKHTGRRSNNENKNGIPPGDLTVWDPSYAGSAIRLWKMLPCDWWRQGSTRLSPRGGQEPVVTHLSGSCYHGTRDHGGLHPFSLSFPCAKPFSWIISSSLKSSDLSSIRAHLTVVVSRPVMPPHCWELSGQPGVDWGWERWAGEAPPRRCTWTAFSCRHFMKAQLKMVSVCSCTCIWMFCYSSSSKSWICSANCDVFDFVRGLPSDQSAETLHKPIVWFWCCYVFCFVSGRSRK